MTKRTLVTVLAAALMGLLALVTNGFAALPSVKEATQQVDTASVAQARQHLGALRSTAKSANDEIPAAIDESPLFADSPVKLDTARMVRGVGRAVWLANSSDGASVCQVTPGALACPPVDYIVAHGLSPAIFTRAGEPVHVSGIASDEVSTVDVGLADGSTTTVAVEHNYFALDVKAVPRELHWAGPSGLESFAFPQEIGK